MIFKVAMELFAPHPALIIFQSHGSVRQVGSQAPGFFFTDLPVNQQIGWVDLLGSQVALTQPETLTGLLNKTVEWFPLAGLIQPDASICFLTQNIPPMPLIEPFQGSYRTKFTV